MVAMNKEKGKFVSLQRTWVWSLTWYVLKQTLFSTQHDSLVQTQWAACGKGAKLLGKTLMGWFHLLQHLFLLILTASISYMFITFFCNTFQNGSENGYLLHSHLPFCLSYRLLWTNFSMQPSLTVRYRCWILYVSPYYFLCIQGI